MRGVYARNQPHWPLNEAVRSEGHRASSHSRIQSPLKVTRCVLADVACVVLSESDLGDDVVGFFEKRIGLQVVEPLC